jgi:hypothetical protein
VYQFCADNRAHGRGGRDLNDETGSTAADSHSTHRDPSAAQPDTGATDGYGSACQFYAGASRGHGNA